jgi:tetratricopeptide (TPR) repeat protein
MYLRTPKRYTARGRQRNIISLRWLWLWILTPIVIYFGNYIYQNRATYGPPVQEAINSVVDNANQQLATAVAPTAPPTQDPGERLVLADAAWQRGAIGEALNEYQAILDAVPNDVTVHYRLTLGLIMQGQLEEALEAAEKTVTANPYAADAWAIRAMALDWNGRPGEAIASALHAIELNPESARAYAFLGEAYFDSGQFDRALETVNRALEMDPNSFEAYRIRGQIVLQTQYDFETAREDFQRAYEIAPNMPYIAIDLALMENALQDTEAAIDRLRALVDLNPQNSQALYWLGVFYYSSIGDPNQAAEYLTRCVQTNPRSVSCNYYLGRVQIGLEQYDIAADSLETAIDLGTSNPVHYWWAARAQAIQGNCPAAVPYLETGYDLALESADTTLIADFEDSMRECQALPQSVIEAESTAEATLEATQEVTE